MSNFSYRELYCPAHFGNTHEMMSAAEMREMCREARHFGYTVYGDWFDPPLQTRDGAFMIPEGAGVGIKNIKDVLSGATKVI